MRLSRDSLLKKFSCLEKYKNQNWFSEEALKDDCNHKELPLRVALVLIQETIKFCDETKFSNRWEEKFSTKVRLQQIQDLLLSFCEDTEEEKTRKGTNLH
jgi:hypothetical protein